MLKRNVVCENISYSFENQTIFENISLGLGNEKIGLVGSNGVGKTTLIRLLIGELKPQAGTIVRNGTIGYLPQQFYIDQERTIASVLGIEHKIAALERITAGTGTTSDFDAVGDDWDMHERVQALLCELNLEHLDIGRTIKTLSGGETTRVFLARLVLSNPDVLILDEPTNNLDHESRLALYKVITSFKGGVLVVSHDRNLLSFMDQIMELSPLGAHMYGGNYQAYVAQKRIEQEAREQDIIDAQKFLKKTKKVIQKTKERYDQRAAKGNAARNTGSQPKILLDYFKNNAEQTKSKLEQKTDKQLAVAKERLLGAKTKLEQKDVLDFDLDATRVHNTKVVLDIKNLTFAYPDQKPIIQTFNLTLVGPQRIAITGSNGSGKTTLLKLIMQQMIPTSGTIKIGVEQYVYLDQNLSILDHEQTIFENFKRLNPNVLEPDCRLRLATFLFTQDDVKKPISILSGGEKMRAALACIFRGDAPPQLVILDEPTNNMDLESIASMESALQQYQGALLVVSHDEVFLENIGIDDRITLSK